MPVTRYYPTASSTTAIPSGLPATEQSTAFPWGTLNTTTLTSSGTTLGRYYAPLSRTKPSTLQGAGTGSTPASSVFAPTTFPSIGQTGRQSMYAGALYMQLGAQTIPSGTWSVAAQLRQENFAENLFLAMSVYVWRPSNSSVVGVIYDSQVQLGAEPTVTGGDVSTLATFTGASVTCQNGDYLIMELWGTQTQSMGSIYATTVALYASTALPDATASNVSSVSGWVDAPDTLLAPTTQAPAGSAIAQSVGATPQVTRDGLELTLFQGTTIIGNRLLVPASLGAAYSDTDFTLTAGEIALLNVGAPVDLTIRWTGSGGVSTIELDEVYLDTTYTSATLRVRARQAVTGGQTATATMSTGVAVALAPVISNDNRRQAAFFAVF